MSPVCVCVCVCVCLEDGTLPASLSLLKQVGRLAVDWPSQCELQPTTEQQTAQQGGLARKTRVRPRKEKQRRRIRNKVSVNEEPCFLRNDFSVKVFSCVSISLLHVYLHLSAVFIPHSPSFCWSLSFLRSDVESEQLSDGFLVCC